MKTKFLIFFGFILISFYTKAQHYYPLPDSNVYWEIWNDNGFGGYNYYQYLTDTISLNKDTVINSYSYAKLFFMNCGLQGPIGAYRSDTNGLTYFVPTDSSNEYLISDFSKNAGDSIYNVLYGPKGIGYTITNFYVDSVNYIMAGPYLLKRIYLSYNASLIQGGAGSCGPIIWIEKVGCANGGFFNNAPICLGKSWISCMSFNDTTYLSNEFNWMGLDISPTYTHGHCDNITGLKNISKHSSTIDIFPNPFSNNIKIGNLKNDKNYHLIIYNTLGELVYDNDNLKPNDNILLINTEYLKPGLYFLSLSSLNNVYCKTIIKE